MNKDLESLQILPEILSICSHDKYYICKCVDFFRVISNFSIRQSTGSTKFNGDNY